MKNLKRLFILASPLLLNACTIYHKDSHAILCRDESAKNFIVTVTDENGEPKPVKFTIVTDIANYDEPILEKQFWARIAGFNRGRKWHTRHSGWESGDEPIPMYYSTEYAYVEKEDGTRVPALAEIREARTPQSSLPGWPFEETTIDINADELQYNRHGMLMYASVYIGFATPPPEPGDKWIIHFGKIQIGDELIDIPPRETCLYEGYTDVDLGMSFLP